MTDGDPAGRLDLPVGYRVGDWELTGPIGRGSWGVVYAARGTADGTRAAVKFLPTHLLPPGQRESMAQLVWREVRFSLEARHPNVVRTREALTVHDADRPELDGVTALVMDRAEASLQERLTARAREGRAPLPDAARVLAGVSAGLAHIHARGWVHGDLKPGNVLLSCDGEVWLGDFGLTAELDGTHAYVPPLGSLDHVPPEWWSDREGGRSVVRPTADIWAFGVLAHQVLTGGLHPFPGSTRGPALGAQAYARGNAELRLDGSLPQHWRELISDCLGPDHTSRAALDAGRLADRVRELERTGRPRPRLLGRLRTGRRRRLTALATAVTVPFVAVGTVVLLQSEDDRGTSRGGGAPSASPSVSGAIPADSDVPEKLRPVITRAALQCAEKEVTPALLAAMLKAESGFDADARRPATDEYGIAMWTPSVFKGWARDGDRDGRKSYMSPADAISAMSDFVCWLDRQYKKEGMRENLPGLMAAGYRTSSRTVIEAGGVPARVRSHVARVERYLDDYTG